MNEAASTEWNRENVNERRRCTRQIVWNTQILVRSRKMNADDGDGDGDDDDDSDNRKIYVNSWLKFVSHLAHATVGMDIFAFFLLLQFGNCGRNKRTCKTGARRKLDAPTRAFLFFALDFFSFFLLCFRCCHCRRNWEKWIIWSIFFEERCALYTRPSWTRTHMAGRSNCTNDRPTKRQRLTMGVWLCVCVQQIVKRRNYPTCDTKCDTYPQIKPIFPCRFFSFSLGRRHRFPCNGTSVSSDRLHAEFQWKAGREMKREKENMNK